MSTSASPASALQRSREYMVAARDVLCRGVGSAMRSSGRPVPLVFERAAGSRLWDIDGNEYIDYVGAYGPALLGHNPDFVVDAVRSQLERGTLFGGQHEGELELARRVIQLVPSAELVALASTGSEAVHAALRVARAATGRSLVVKFEGHYHGWLDPVHVNTPGMPPAPSGSMPAVTPMPGSAGPDVVVLPWNDLDQLEATFDRIGDDVAAVLMEPVACNAGALLPADGYLDAVRDLCSARGGLLVFDEVITGFRLRPGGAQELLGVIPDLTVLAKAVGGGFPVAMLAGRRRVMSVAADGPLGLVGTYNGNALGVAAANAVLEYVDRARDSLYDELDGRASALAAGLYERATARGLPLEVNRLGSVVQLLWSRDGAVRSYRDVTNCDADMAGRFAELMVERGVYVLPRGLWFVSAAHDDDDVRATLDVANLALDELAAEGMRP